MKSKKFKPILCCLCGEAIGTHAHIIYSKSHRNTLHVCRSCACDCPHCGGKGFTHARNEPVEVCLFCEGTGTDNKALDNDRGIILSEFPPAKGVYRVTNIRSVQKTVGFNNQNPLGVIHHTTWSGSKQHDMINPGGFPYYVSLRIVGIGFKGNFLLSRAHLFDPSPWLDQQVRRKIESMVKTDDKFLKLIYLYDWKNEEKSAGEIVWHCDRLVDRDAGFIEYDVVRGCYVIGCRKPTPMETAYFLTKEITKTVSRLKW